MCIHAHVFLLQATGKHMVYIGEPEQSGSGLTPDGRPRPPKDYLGLALFSLLCCCFPIGVIALIKSLEVTRAVHFDTNYSYPDISLS